MQITTITRTISGNSYDNVSATAMLDNGDDPIQAIKDIDEKLRQALSEIDEGLLAKIAQKESESGHLGAMPF